MGVLITVLLLLDGFPWAIPLFPFIPDVEVPVIELSDPVHSEDYEANLTELETTVETWTEPIDEVNGVMDNWLGTTATQMPDTTSGDFSTGLQPVDDIGTAYEFAEWLGTSIGTLFQYMRSISNLPGTVVTVLIGGLLAVSGWLFFIRMLKYVMQIFDAGWSLARDIYHAIMEFIPL
jgi:hypothetical protein